MLEYKIVEKAQFTVMGKVRSFNADNSYVEVPKFWEELMQSEDNVVVGMYGICLGIYGDRLDYMIADNYIPWNDIPEGYETRVIPAGTWAVFPCRGPLPKSIQDLNTQIWSEWLPNSKEFKLAGNYNIEMYSPCSGDPDNFYSEIWIPVEKI